MSSPPEIHDEEDGSLEPPPSFKGSLFEDEEKGMGKHQSDSSSNGRSEWKSVKQRMSFAILFLILILMAVLVPLVIRRDHGKRLVQQPQPKEEPASSSPSSTPPIMDALGPIIVPGVKRPPKWEMNSFIDDYNWENGAVLLDQLVDCASQKNNITDSDTNFDVEDDGFPQTCVQNVPLPTIRPKMQSMSVSSDGLLEFFCSKVDTAEQIPCIQVMMWNASFRDESDVVFYKESSRLYEQRDDAYLSASVVSWERLEIRPHVTAQVSITPTEITVCYNEDCENEAGLPWYCGGSLHEASWFGAGIWYQDNDRFYSIEDAFEDTVAGETEQNVFRFLPQRPCVEFLISPPWETAAKVPVDTSFVALSELPGSVLLDPLFDEVQDAAEYSLASLLSSRTDNNETIYFEFFGRSIDDIVIVPTTGTLYLVEAPEVYSARILVASPTSFALESIENGMYQGVYFWNATDHANDKNTRTLDDGLLHIVSWEYVSLAGAEAETYLNAQVQFYDNGRITFCWGPTAGPNVFDDSTNRPFKIDVGVEDLRTNRVFLPGIDGDARFELRYQNSCQTLIEPDFSSKVIPALAFERFEFLPNYRVEDVVYLGGSRSVGVPHQSVVAELSAPLPWFNGTSFDRIEVSTTGKIVILDDDTCSSANHGSNATFTARQQSCGHINIASPPTENFMMSNWSGSLTVAEATAPNEYSEDVLLGISWNDVVFFTGDGDDIIDAGDSASINANIRFYLNGTVALCWGVAYLGSGRMRTSVMNAGIYAPRYDVFLPAHGFPFNSKGDFSLSTPSPEGYCQSFHLEQLSRVDDNDLRNSTIQV